MTGGTLVITKGGAGMTRGWRFFLVIPFSTLIPSFLVILFFLVIPAEAGIQTSFPRRWESKPF
jgi:hypothetical protein